MDGSSRCSGHDIDSSSEENKIHVDYIRENEYNEYSFTGARDTDLILTSAPRLEQIASVSIAIALWNHATDLLPMDDEECALYHRVKEWIEQLPLPKLFAEYIEHYFKEISRNVYDWISYHVPEVFNMEESKHEQYRCTRSIAWSPDGTIDYCETASRLLKSNRLSDLEKYRLACTYCLEYEMEKQWQTLVGNRDRLNIEKQVSVAFHSIKRSVPRYQKMILAKQNTNKFRRQKGYAYKAGQIIRNYPVCNGDDIYGTSAILAWYEVRDLIKRDQFVTLLKLLCSDYAIDAVLVEIWTNANVELKRHVCNLSNYDDFIADVLEWAHYKEGNGFDFLFAVLREGAKIPNKQLKAPTFKRKKFFYKLCRNMISNCKLKSLTRLLNLCVSNVEHCAKLKLILARKAFTNDRRLL